MLRSRQSARAAAVLCVLACASATAQEPGAPTGARLVDVDGHAVRVQTLGLENRREGSPVVVFEAGLTNSLETWGSVLPQVAALAPAVAYDRAGVGRSEWDQETPTPQHVVNRLHRLLELVGAKAPFVLVGHSWGGVLARYFAGYYPRDVAALVYVDPGPIITDSRADQLAPFEAVGPGRAGYDAYWSNFAAFLRKTPPAVRAEFDVLRGLMERDPADRDLRPVPDVPIVVLVATKFLSLPAITPLPYDARAHFDIDVRHRISKLQEWALASSRGTLVVSNQTSHAITRDDPDLIVWAVKRVLSAVGRP